MQKKKGDTEEGGGRRVREKENKKGTEISRDIWKKHTEKKQQIKEIRLLASSQISAFRLKSVSIAAKSIIG